MIIVVIGPTLIPQTGRASLPAYSKPPGKDPSCSVPSRMEPLRAAVESGVRLLSICFFLDTHNGIASTPSIHHQRQRLGLGDGEHTRLQPPVPQDEVVIPIQAATSPEDHRRRPRLGRATTSSQPYAKLLGFNVSASRPSLEAIKCRINLAADLPPETCSSRRLTSRERDAVHPSMTTRCFCHGCLGSRGLGELVS